MKKLSLALFAISMMAAAALAQGKANYSGTWNLDKDKSTMSGPMRIDGMTLTVAHTDKEIKVETATKRLPPNDTPGAPTAGAPGTGPGRRGGMGMGGMGAGGQAPFGGGAGNGGDDDDDMDIPDLEPQE